jgi:hypothetical protein
VVRGIAWSSITPRSALVPDLVRAGFNCIFQAELPSSRYECLSQLRHNGVLKVERVQTV